jgi:hypothetical protein
MISVIINNLLLKSSFAFSLIISFISLIIPNDSGASDFIDSMLNAVPTIIAGYLGIIYGLAIVFKKLSQTFKSIKIDLLDIKIAAEMLKQKEIETKKLDSK